MTTIKSKDTEMVNVTISVLSLKEEGEWCAIALEMDLRGYGKTNDEAIRDLLDHVQMQVSFAVSQGKPELIDRPAEGKYWEMFSQLKRKALMDLATPSVKPQKRTSWASDIPLFKGMLHVPPAQKFERVCAS